MNRENIKTKIKVNGKKISVLIIDWESINNENFKGVEFDSFKNLFHV